MLWNNVYFLFFSDIIIIGEHMKKILMLLPLLVLLLVTFIYKDNISNYIIEKIFFSKEIYIENSNEYDLDYDFSYVKKTDNFIAQNRQQVLDILYTILNSGVTDFYFYCDYDNCKDDVSYLTNSYRMININNYVHPYNNYQKVTFSINSFNKITIEIKKLYSDTDIAMINDKLDELIEKLITDEMTTKEKITVFHNYIIDNTVYDSEYLNNGSSSTDNPSNKATGPLFFGKALCGGYTDIMAIFLNKLNIPNYRISGENHVWNFVYVDGDWYHLDLTWDDPVTSDNTNLRLDNFLLITTEQLEELNTGYHEYDKSVYLEAK